MPDFKSARSYFGDLMTRLQRWAGLETPIPVEFSPTAVPVVISADVSGVGYGNERNRGWAKGTVIAGQGSFGVGMLSDATVDGMVIGNRSAVTAMFWWQALAPTQAPGVLGAITVGNCPYTDRRLTANDFAPIQSNIIALGGAAAPTDLAGGVSLLPGTSIFIPLLVACQAQGGFVIRCETALGEITCSLYGRVL